MAKVFPRRVVQLIDQLYPWAMSPGGGRLTMDDRAGASALVELADHVPAELLPTDQSAFTEFVCGVAAIRTAVAGWESGRSQALDSVPGLAGHPVMLIRRALDGLPDEPAAPPMRYLSPALSLAFDFLDTVWRLKFGRKHKLLQLRLLTPTTDLERDCLTREEFQSRLSALADTLKSMRIDDQLLKDYPKKGDITPEQSFNRLLVSLEGVLEPKSFTTVKTAVERLRTINDLRISDQHADTSVNRAAALKKLGISNDPDLSWKEKWNRVRSTAAEALQRIAAELNASV